MENNIGLLTIRWESDPVIDMGLVDDMGNTRSTYSIKRSQLTFMSNPVIAHRGAFKRTDSLRIQLHRSERLFGLIAPVLNLMYA